MLGDILATMIGQLIKSKMPPDQKIRLSFEPPKGKIIVKHLHDKNKNDTYEISFKQIKDIFDKT
ncbi:hypothetical protein ES702_05961 [subsurface metagenome]